MVNIAANNIITITRGDTAVFYFNIKVDSESYTLTENDRVYFGIMEPNKNFEHAIVKKVFTAEDVDSATNNLCVSFSSEDTEFLVPGVYYYELKLFRPGDITSLIIEDRLDKVNTLIEKKKFVIL